MDKATNLRKALKWTLIALVSLVVIAVLVVGGTAALVDAGYFHAPILRYLVARSGREIRVAGPVDTTLLSLHPKVTARQVVIGNPPWMPPGNTAEIAQLSVEIDLSLLPPSWAIRSLQLEEARLHLLRDEKGLANWRAKPLRSGDGPPLIHSISIRAAQVDLHDARRHLDFEGIVSAQDAPVARGLRPLRIEGSGQLNSRAVTFTIDGDPLATASHRKPYLFRFSETSSGSRLTGSGTLFRPFDFRGLTATFEAAGEDMQDLFFLTGLTLPDTGAYQLAGKVVRSDLRFNFTDLVATTGGSDMRGSAAVDSTGERTQIDARLQSQLLRLKDLGKKAAGRSTRTKGAPLLPDTPLRLKALRRNDVTMKFQVDHLDAGRIQMKAATAAVKVDHGKLSIAPSASFADGNLSGQITFDASHEVPQAEMNLAFTGLRLDQLHKGDAGEPPFEGLLRGRVTMKGTGISVHRIAASANGKVTVVLPRGAMRASLAELAGVNLRGIGLMLSDNKKPTAVRCAVASFDIDNGIASTHSVVLDTTPVLVTGTGTIDLNSEAIDLSFRGQPKRTRLRLRGPLTVRGTLAKPSIGVGAGKSAAQGGAAVALAVLLTPLAAVLAFVDPGLTKDADCAALLAEAGTTR